MTDPRTGLDMDLSSGIAAYEAKHFSRASGLLSPLAEQGDPEALYRVAIMAQNGLGMCANPLLAHRYMHAAAQAGHALAQHGLGFMYLAGECAPKDPTQAAVWFRKAAEQGLAGSMLTLALLYEQGQGVPQDAEEAACWYQRASQEQD